MRLAQRDRIGRALSAIEAGAAAAGAFVVVSQWIAPVCPALDTFGQLSEPWLFLCGAALAMGVWRARWRSAAALALVCVGLGLALWPQLSGGGSAPRPQGSPVRIYFNNLWTDNANGEAIERSIKAAAPDIVALVQVSAKNRAFVDAALAPYPYHYWSRRVSRAGGHTVVASRFPLIGQEPVCAAPDSPPGFEMAVRAPTPIRLIVVHLTRPWPYRANQLHDFERLVRELENGGGVAQTVIVGDFNATLSSAAQKGFQRRTGLHPLPAALGDWPTWLPPPLRIAIENAFAGNGLSLTSRRLAGYSGSDHQPLLFDVSRAAAAAAGPLPATAGRPACLR